MIDCRKGDRVQDPVGHIGRSGDLQEMAAGMRMRLVSHEASFQFGGRVVWPGKGGATRQAEVRGDIPQSMKAAASSRASVRSGEKSRLPALIGQSNSCF